MHGHGKGTVRGGSVGRRAFVALSAGAGVFALCTALGCAGVGGTDGGAEPDGGAKPDPADSGDLPGRAAPGHGGEASAPDPATSSDARIDALLADMPIEHKVAQLFMVRPEALTGVGQVIQAGEATRAALARRPVGGLIYFSHNIVEAQQFRDLLADTAAIDVSVPPFLGVDEEGGPLVARVANSGLFDVAAFPNMAEIGAAGDADVALEVGSTIGCYLADLGITVDFAPVADVLTNAQSSIGARAFSDDPALVAAMVAREVEGLQGAGVLAVPKHFPGHGDAAADSHTGAAVSERSLDELRACEFAPFRAAIDAGARMVMVGHISTPRASGDDLPATLSPTAIEGWLRGELGFDGVVVSDAMNMGAVTQRASADRAAVEFIAAGGDLVLDPEDFELAFQGVLAAVREGELSEERIDASLRRILGVKHAWLVP